MTVSGKARLAGVMGWPVSHSLSPVVHGYWLGKLGIDGAYVPLAVRPEDCVDVLRTLPKMSFRGCNLTLPHKTIALDAMDDLDPQAARIGAVNTVIVDDDGRLIGRNTDGFGFLASLHTTIPTWRPQTGPAVVLGAGGAARAVLAVLQDAGVPELRLANRTADKTSALAAEFGFPVRPVTWEERHAALEGAALLVNTTSLGMVGQPTLDLRLDALPKTATVADIVYVPLETDLLRRASNRGHPVADGLGMLLHQAVPGFEAWFGQRPRVTLALRRRVLEHLG